MISGQQIIRLPDGRLQLITLPTTSQATQQVHIRPAVAAAAPATTQQQQPPVAPAAPAPPTLLPISAAVQPSATAPQAPLTNVVTAVAPSLAPTVVPSSPIRVTTSSVGSIGQPRILVQTPQGIAQAMVRAKLTSQPLGQSPATPTITVRPAAVTQPTLVAATAAAQATAAQVQAGGTKYAVTPQVVQQGNLLR